MMGVPPMLLNELPSSDDNDTDSIRRRALWSLEGKSGGTGPSADFMHGWGSVEIPDLNNPDLDVLPDFGTSLRRISDAY